MKALRTIMKQALDIFFYFVAGVAIFGSLFVFCLASSFLMSLVIIALIPAVAVTAAYLRITRR